MNTSAADGTRTVATPTLDDTPSVRWDPSAELVPPLLVFTYVFVFTLCWVNPLWGLCAFCCWLGGAALYGVARL